MKAPKNKPAKIASKATAKSSSAGGVNTPPKGAVPSKKKGGSK